MDTKKYTINKKNKKRNNISEAVGDCFESRDFDPQGSYTGKPTDGYIVPVQDADDL